MSTTTTNNTYAETVFSQGAYEAEDFEQDAASNASGWESVETTSDMPEAREYRKRYVPPFKRKVNLEMGDETHIDPTGEPAVMGVAAHAFQRLLVYVSFALVKDMAMKLGAAFPGMYFQSISHNNHDHPFSHTVTQVGTRILQRFIKPGWVGLDVYGNVGACERFNHSQRKANNPKQLWALVAKACPADFIREVNKQGPRVDAEGERYANGHILKQTMDFLSVFNFFTFIHTLYYIKPAEIVHLLHSPMEGFNQGGFKKMGYALIHSHSGTHGFLNEGEQEYWVKNGIVKQRNVKTNTTYCHPDITPFWFAENKTWKNENGIGFTWECHFVCKDTWIVEICAADFNELDEDFANDWEEQFNAPEVLLGKDVVEVARSRKVEMLPTKNGKFIPLHVVSDELFNDLRSYCMGRPRHGMEGAQLMKDLLVRARNNIRPNALFPDKVAMKCPDEYVIDHCVSAFLTDMERETNLVGCLDNVQNLMYQHSMTITGKRPAATIQGMDFVGAMKMMAAVGVKGARIARSKDVAKAALDGIEQFVQ